MSKCKKLTPTEAVRLAEKQKGSKLTADERKATRLMATQGPQYVCGTKRYAQSDTPRRPGRGRRYP